MNQIFLRAVFASLPLLGLGGGLGKGMAYGAVGGGLLLAATAIFLGVRPILPPPVHRVSFLLLLFSMTVILGKIFSLSALLGVSLLLLIFPDLFRKQGHWKRIMRKTLGASFLFLVFLTGHGILTDLARLAGGIGFFQLPAGSFFLAGLLLSFPPFQRIRK